MTTHALPKTRRKYKWNASMRLGAFDALPMDVISNCLLPHPSLCLLTKRAMACTNRGFQCLLEAQLTKEKLVVRAHDCSLQNARYILQKLMPAVPGLLVCAEGEQFNPQMDLAKLQRLNNVRVCTSTCSMSPTAAYFLGHALAHSDALVRLTTGQTKRITSLRCNRSLYLSAEDTASIVDEYLMQPALLANAERRLKNHLTNPDYIMLGGLYLTDAAACSLRDLNKRAWDRCAPMRLDLSDNPIGSRGLDALLVTPCRERASEFGGYPGIRTHMLHLNLCRTRLGLPGILLLSSALRAGYLSVKELYVTHCGLCDDGMIHLVAALRENHRRGGNQPLKCLSLSDNWFGDSGFLQLVEQENAFPDLQDLLLCRLRLVSRSSYVMLCRFIRNGRIPNLERVHADVPGFGANIPFDDALKLLRAEREANRLRKRWAEWEESEEKRRKICTGDGELYKGTFPVD